MGFNLAKNMPQLCPGEVPAFDLVLQHLPIRADEPESKKVNESLVGLIRSNHPSLGPGSANAAKVLAILAEIYHDESICEETLEPTILEVVRTFPEGVIQNCLAHLSEKQQKKIQKMRL